MTNEQSKLVKEKHKNKHSSISANQYTRPQRPSHSVLYIVHSTETKLQIAPSGGLCLPNNPNPSNLPWINIHFYSNSHQKHSSFFPLQSTNRYCSTDRKNRICTCCCSAERTLCAWTFTLCLTHTHTHKSIQWQAECNTHNTRMIAPPNQSEDRYQKKSFLQVQRFTVDIPCVENLNAHNVALLHLIVHFILARSLWKVLGQKRCSKRTCFKNKTEIECCSRIHPRVQSYPCLFSLRLYQQGSSFVHR